MKEKEAKELREREEQLRKTIVAKYRIAIHKALCQPEKEARATLRRALH